MGRCFDLREPSQQYRCGEHDVIRLEFRERRFEILDCAQHRVAIWLAHCYLLLVFGLRGVRFACLAPAFFSGGRIAGGRIAGGRIFAVSDALRAVASAASPLTKSAQLTSSPLRRPLSAKVKPSAESVSV